MEGEENRGVEVERVVGESFERMLESEGRKDVP